MELKKGLWRYFVKKVSKQLVGKVYIRGLEHLKDSNLDYLYDSDLDPIYTLEQV